jgi:hypothetical protein
MFNKYWIIGIVLVILFAYYLGITISTVVDYRLKDAIINLPEPKIYIDSKNIEKFINNDSDNDVDSKKKKKSSKKEKFQNKKKFEHFEPTITKSSQDTIIDQNQKAYAMSYKLAKTLMDNPMPFKAANSYDYDQLYSMIEKKGIE